MLPPSFTLQVYHDKYGCEHHCFFDCKICFEVWKYQLDQDVPSAACGGNGGNGGDGGNGGPPGMLTIKGGVDIEVQNVNEQSAGGFPGMGSLAGSGIKVKRTFTGRK